MRSTSSWRRAGSTACSGRTARARPPSSAVSSGLAKPTSGEVRVLGVKMPDREILARIGYMTQADGIYIELSVWENLRFFAALSGQRDKAAMDEVLEIVELTSRRNTPALNLSGGMRRRLSLACALVHRPSVLFLDEPTVGIDPALRVQFWAYFRKLASDGATLVVSSHVMDEADRCDELLLMLHGKLLARGSGAQIRERAGTQDIEAGLPEARQWRGRAGARRGEPVRSPNRSPSAVASPIFFRRDERTLALVFVAPIVIMGLLGWVIRDQAPPATRDRGCDARRTAGRRRAPADQDALTAAGWCPCPTSRPTMRAGRP